MPTKKIAELEDTQRTQPTCHHPDHEPPTEAEILPATGVFEHVCVACGTSTVFTVGGAADHPVPRRHV